MDLKYEELSETLNRVNSWIENCDSKVSTILSGIGVFRWYSPSYRLCIKVHSNFPVYV